MKNNVYIFSVHKCFDYGLCPKKACGGWLNEHSFKGRVGFFGMTYFYFNKIKGDINAVCCDIKWQVRFTLWVFKIAKTDKIEIVISNFIC